MQLDPKLKEILDGLDPSEEEPVEEMDPEKARAVWKEEMAAVAGAPLPVKSVSERAVPGPAGPLTMRLYEPDGAGAGPLPILVYYHGGGHVIGSLDTHHDVARHMAREAGIAVVSVQYRKAPEHKFPVPAEDCFQALEWVAANAAGLGVAFRAKPILEAAADVRIRHGDLTALLYLQGYRREELVDG